MPAFLLSCSIRGPGCRWHGAQPHRAQGLEALRKSKPAAFFHPDLSKLITIGNFDDHLKFVAESDWVIEAVVENLEIKRALLKKVEAVRRPGTVVTTNTSGLPVRIAEGFRKISAALVRHALLQSAALHAAARDHPHAGSRSGRHGGDRAFQRRSARAKAIVFAKDTPNFIANRIGMFSVLNLMRLMQQMDLRIEEVDALTGTADRLAEVGDASAPMDMVGLDVLGHVVTT